MGESTYTRGTLTIPHTAVDQWSRTLPDGPCDDPGVGLVSHLTDLIAEDAYEPIEVHHTDDGLHIELYGDYCSNGLQPFLDGLARSGATGRVLFPEGDLWGYTLTPEGAIAQDGAQLYPGDEMLLLTIDIPGRDRHRAVYSTDHAVCRAIHALHAEWFGRNSTPADLDAALAALIAAGAEATCEALPFAS
ncbi:hypothetical protein AB0331_15300 [Dietzia maris]|uniref:hypothetical protein n=1 Tax=Dietzia maris TaxID=37915 RepID=UPI0034505C72